MHGIILSHFAETWGGVGRESTLFENQFGFSRTSKYCWLASSRRKGSEKSPLFPLVLTVEWHEGDGAFPVHSLLGLPSSHFLLHEGCSTFVDTSDPKRKIVVRQGMENTLMVRFFLCPNFGARLLHVSQTPSLHPLFSLFLGWGGMKAKLSFLSS